MNGRPFPLTPRHINSTPQRGTAYLIMKTKLMAALWLLLTCGNIMAQTQKTLTLDQLMWGGSEYWNFIPKTPHLAWWGDCSVQQDVYKATL